MNSPHTDAAGRVTPVGRGARNNPANRFERIQYEPAWWDADAAAMESLRPTKTQFIPDDSKTVVSENNSPDLEFRYSLNPYRGCEHGCSYCYARPYHEFLGYSAGLDFETKIVYKPKIADQLRQWLRRPGWQAEFISLSGATDCYQPAEKQFQLTRACLEVALECRQPLSIVTKNALVLRDLDLLEQLAQRQLVHVNISLTSLHQSLVKVMEPRTSSPTARLRAMSELTAAGVPTRALLAPIIPGLNDSELPALLEAVQQAGVRSAGTILLRLPNVVQDVFLEWLQTSLPDQAEKIESRVRQTRATQLDDTRFGVRMRGEGELARQIHQTFEVFSKRFGLIHELPPLNSDDFRRPGDRQGRLF